MYAKSSTMKSTAGPGMPYSSAPASSFVMERRGTHFLPSVKRLSQDPRYIVQLRQRNKTVPFRNSPKKGLAVDDYLPRMFPTERSSDDR